MKKLLALSALALSFTSTTAFASTTQVVHIAGEVVGQTCQFDNGSNSSVQLLKLDPIQLADLEAGKDNAKEFSFKLKGCDTKSTQQVSVAFDTNHQHVTADGFLANYYITTGTGANVNENAATGVQFKIMNEKGAVINLKDPNAAKSAGIVQRLATGGNAEFKFQAGYVVEKNVTPTTGLVASNIPVKIAYQ